MKIVSFYHEIKRSVGYTLFLDKGKTGESQRRKATGTTAFNARSASYRKIRVTYVH